MTIWRTLVTGFATLIVILGVAHGANAAGVRSELAAESTLETVLQRGVLRVGFDTFVPWAMKDKDGNYTGFEIEVAEQLAKDMGVEVRFVPTKWSGIIPALLTGKFDIIIGGMSIMPQRNLKVNFSIPYEHSGMSIVANKGLVPGFTKLEDFNDSNVTIAVRLGTTAAEATRNLLPKAKIQYFDDEAKAVQEMLNGRAHAVVASSPLPRIQAQMHPDKLYLPLTGDFTSEPIGFAVRKGDPDLLNFLDNWIRVTEAKGWLKNRYDYWFNGEDWKGRIE